MLYLFPFLVCKLAYRLLFMKQKSPVGIDETANSKKVETRNREMLVNKSLAHKHWITNKPQEECMPTLAFSPKTILNQIGATKMSVKSIVILFAFILIFSVNLYATEYSLQLNGSSQYVDCGNNSYFDLTNNLTVEAWIYPTNFKTGRWDNVIASKVYWTSDNTYGWDFRYGSSYRTLEFNMSGGGNVWTSCLANYALTLNTWQHVAATYNGSVMKLYVNGIEVASENATSNIPTTTQKLCVGAIDQGSGIRFMTGKIDEVRIWKVARTASEIANNLYNSVSDANLLAYFQMNAGSGTVLSNSANASYNGTLAGSPSWSTDIPYYACAVTTQAATSVDRVSAIAHGTISNLGSPYPTQHGHCWSISDNPSLENSYSQLGSTVSTGEFSSIITDLSPNTTYYIRAYASTAVSTEYGLTQSFTTLDNDFPAGVSTQVDIGSGVMVTINPTAPLNYAVDQTIPDLPNHSFSPLFQTRLSGNGVVNIVIETDAAWGAYNQGDQWFSVSNAGSSISFIGVDLDTKGDVSIVLGDEDPTLPVVLSSFTAVISGQNLVSINWVTQSETNLSGYGILRNTASDLNTALDLQQFIPASNSSTTHTYSFVEEAALEPGTYYYWLKAIELTGESSFHGPAMITFTADGGSNPPPVPVPVAKLNVFPNPFNPLTRIAVFVPAQQNGQCSIYNARGELVYEFASQSFNEGWNYLSWNGADASGQSCGSGIYLIRISGNNLALQSKVVLMK